MINIHAFVGIRTSKTNKRADEWLHLRQSGHRDQTSVSLTHYNIAPCDAVNLVGYRSGLMLPLLSRGSLFKHVYIQNKLKLLKPYLYSYTPVKRSSNLIFLWNPIM